MDNKNNYQQSEHILPKPQGQQYGYVPPVQDNPFNVYTQGNMAPMTLGQWLITMIIMAVPILNIVMLFVWAFGDTNLNKKNFAKAYILIIAIGIIIVIISWILFSTLLKGLGSLKFTV